MGPQQPNALLENPNQLNLVCVARYERLIKANIARVWENVRDWEHLPWLHSTSFDFVSLDTEGDWGWRTWSSPTHNAHVELCIDLPQQRYVARSYRNQTQISEIWTTLTESGENTQILVEFQVPNVSPQDQNKVGQLFLDLYQTLWDEDEAMMQARQLQLTPLAPGPASANLESAATFKQSLPRLVKIRSQTFRISLVADEPVVYSTTCPHLLGPLSEADSLTGEVSCPWHGYRFDVFTGACLAPATAKCRLRLAPSLRLDPVSGDMLLGDE
jgi:nitrite reductase/ring-hydroxylating ferredoxin subunit